MRVLIAHPCVATRGWLRLALLREPAHFDAVSSAPDALEHMAERSYDLVILAHGLAGMPGPQLLASMRTAGISAPVILLSPLCRESVRALIRRVNAAELVEDPYDAHALRDAVRSLLPSPWSRRLARRTAWA